MRTPNIIISHQLRYNGEYNTLKRKMDELSWRHLDYSVPSHSPLNIEGKRRIAAALKEQVRQCNFFIVFARMAAVNSEWVRKEVEFALEYGKYILGVRPHGYNGDIPIFIQEACDDIFGFNTNAIIR